MKRLALAITTVVFALFINVGAAKAAGTDITVQCTTSTCTVTPGSVPMFNEQNIWPGYSVTHSINAQNNTIQNGEFGITAAEVIGGEEVSSILKNHIFIEIRQGSNLGPVVYGAGNSKTLGNLFSDTQSSQIVLGNMGPSSSQLFFVKATLDPNSGNELMNQNITFDLGLGYDFTPTSVSPTPTVSPGNGGPGEENPGNGGNNAGNNGGGGGNGGSGGGASAAPVCSDPAPSNAPVLFFNESSTSDGQVTLSWSASSGATHYAINFGVQPGTYIYGNSNVGNVTSYTVTGLTPGGNYYFQVIGINGCAPGPRSNEVSTGGSAVLGAVNAPTGFGGSVLGVNEATAEGEINGATNAGSVAGEVLGDSTCNPLKQYLPLIFLLIQTISALVIYAIVRRPENKIKHVFVLGIATALTVAFYLFRSCNCFEANLWSFLCQWYIAVAVVLAGVLQFVNYSLIEKEE